MTKIVRLKTANSSALADIRNLLNQLSESNKKVTPASLKKVLKHPDIEIWVARDGARIVGMATLVVMHKLYATASDVEDVVVDENYRGHGLGKALMKKLMERARARRASCIALTSNPSRTAANAMYQKLGFKKRETNVYRLKF
ncbi:MAG: GNAT family N-acetyltransferase [bacterium]|nr:GNAT family N-acetyltransferase [bacterium]